MPPESSPSFPWRLWGAIFRSLQGTESLGPSLEADILRGQLIDVFSASSSHTETCPARGVPTLLCVHGSSVLGTWRPR